ncbi:copper homeostasis protein CutC [Rubrivirga sp. IMCC43871]|uniref:copper homeostasis protein CutC n=1 Tax=Rubrivirga sp. IMCC43871 TaxID=3391575 RepID=UPI00398FC473
MPRVLLEIAAFDPASALAAADAGADRIELCRDAEVGGLTPPLDWVREVTAATEVPVVAMVRAHADGWTFTPDEHAAMRDDARAVVEAGAAGVVWGALRPDGTVDAEALAALVDAVAPHPVTVHRAFDAAPDASDALAAVRAAGAVRILTSGGAATAREGLDRLATLAHAAGDAVSVMPGGGVRASNVVEIVRRTGAREVHSAASAPGTAYVDADEVRRVRARLDALPR